jgi:hypothetical protein
MHSQYKNIKNTVTKKGTDTIYKETKDIKLNVKFNNATPQNFFFQSRVLKFSIALLFIYHWDSKFNILDPHPTI